MGKEYFPYVLKSMHTLWLYAALVDEITHLMRALETAGVGCMLLLDVFVLVSTLTVMNMLVGVLCEVVSAVASAEKEELSVSIVKTKLERVFDELGLGHSTTATVSRMQFNQILENHDAARAIQDLGVDVVQMVDMADSFFHTEDAGSFKMDLSFDEFVDAVVQLRGSNYATVKDLVNLRTVLSKQLATSELKTQSAVRRVSTMSGLPGSLPGSAPGSQRPSVLQVPGPNLGSLGIDDFVHASPFGSRLTNETEGQTSSMTPRQITSSQPIGLETLTERLSVGSTNHELS